jgi:uncharacterized protein (DUF1810 family)
VTDADLIHFVNAQAHIYRQVVEELTDGHKRTHWMWFIFPQLSGLGHSAMAFWPQDVYYESGAAGASRWRLAAGCAATCRSSVPADHPAIHRRRRRGHCV